jgi:response regulator RpfG family c-di-GMP phosphodiesterase
LERAKLIALTAFSDEAYVQCSRKAGFDLHLVKPTDPLEIKRQMDMLSKVVELAGKTEEMARQNVAVATETKELIREVKVDMKEVKEDIKEIKEDVKELKEEVREVKEERADEHPSDRTPPGPDPR